MFFRKRTIIFGHLNQGDLLLWKVLRSDATLLLIESILLGIIPDSGEYQYRDERN